MIVRNPLPGVRNAVSLGCGLSFIDRPYPCVERHGVNDLFLGNLLQGVLYPVFYIGNGCNRTSIPARVMFIISHDDYIIRHNPLLPSVIKGRIRGRDVIINGQHQPLLSAGHGQFPDELYIVGTGLCLQALKIQIESVKSIGIGFLHKVFNQFPARAGGGHKCLGIKVLHAFLRAYVFYHGPYLKPHLMGFVHVLLAGKGIIGSIVRYHIEPGRHNHIHILCNRHIAFQGIVGLLARHLMESKTDLFIHGNACIYRRLKGTLRRDLFPAIQPAVLNVTDIAVFGTHPGPLLHGFQHIHLLSLLKFCEDWAFHPSLFPYMPCFVYFSDIVRLP